ncbi:putative protein phosphatase 2C 54 [Hordeum vulgare]|nr:putative protein phosphatase 2C 54 [Hordeum vulgare]
MAAVVAAAATTEHARPPPPACSASCAVASLVFEAMEGGRGEGVGGPADLSQDMAACESRIVQGRSLTAEADSAFDGAILCARSLAQCGGSGSSWMMNLCGEPDLLRPRGPCMKMERQRQSSWRRRARRTRCDASVHAVPNHLLDNCDDEIYCHMVAGREMESVCENTTTADFKQSSFSNFLPIVRSGGWSDIGSRQYMEDTHVCIADLAKNFGYPIVDKEVVSFYGVCPGRAATAMAALPVMKLGMLLLRTLSKPIANRLKSQAAVHPKFRDFIISIAQVKYKAKCEAMKRINKE